MKRFFAILAVLMLLAAAPGALGCTAFYVGRQASTDGTVIMAKSNDNQSVWGNHITLTERVENVPGRSMPVDQDATVYTPIPATTYRYTATPWMDSTTALNGLIHDATVCTNEYGVAMEMSITAFSNKAALATDPLIPNGLGEQTAVDLVVCQSATAREAVQVLFGLIDTYGSAEVGIALIADQKEAWYVEIYTGHQYAAVKLPEDAVSAFGNEFTLEYVSAYEDSILSPDLMTLPVEKGFAVYGEQGEMNLMNTYSGPETLSDYSHMRTWYMHQLLAPSAYGDYQEDGIYPLCFKAEKKVSVQDVMELLRNRYEGTEYSPDETGRTDMRVVGSDTAMSVHIVQLYPDLPAEMSCVTWECTGPAVYGVFVPVSNAALSISLPYARNQGKEAMGEFDTVLYPYYRIKELNTLCVEAWDYLVFGMPVREYWHKAETGMAAGMAEVLAAAGALEDRAEARRLITEYCNRMQEQAFEDAGRLLNSVRWYKSQLSNTLKNGRDPETHKVLNELRDVDPLKITLDPAPYYK